MRVNKDTTEIMFWDKPTEIKRKRKSLKSSKKEKKEFIKD